MHLVLLALLQAPAVLALRADGVSTLTADSPAFMAYFAMGPDGARLEWSLDAEGPASLVLYDEATFQRVTSRPADCNCECKLGAALAGYSATFEAGSSANSTFIATRTGRPAYLFAVLLSCGGGAANVVQWSLHFERASGVYREIPWDATGLLQVYCGSVAVASAMLIYIVIAHGWWSQRAWYLTPPPVKVFGLCVALWVADAGCIAAHFLRYAQDGYGEADVEGFGRLVEVAGRLVFIMLLLLLARGWAVQFSALPPVCSSTTKRLEGACLSYFVLLLLAGLYLVMAVWYLIDREPGSTIYVYDSTPGLTECGAQFATGFFFLLVLRRTHAREVRGQHAAWLFNLGVVCGFYFATLPIAVLVALLALNDYEDERTVEMTMQAARLVFFGFVLLSTMTPAKSELIFAAWQPDLAAVKLLRNEVASVDLLTPVMSGFSTPMPFGQGLAMAAASSARVGGARRFGPGYGALATSSLGVAGLGSSESGASSPARRLAASRSANSRKGASKLPPSGLSKSASSTSVNERALLKPPLPPAPAPASLPPPAPPLDPAPLPAPAPLRLSISLPPADAEERAEAVPLLGGSGGGAADESLAASAAAELSSILSDSFLSESSGAGAVPRKGSAAIGAVAARARGSSVHASGGKKRRESQLPAGPRRESSGDT